MRTLQAIGGGLLAASLAVGAVALPAASAVASDSAIDQLAVVVVGDGSAYANVAGPVALRIVDSTGAVAGDIGIPVDGGEGQHGFTLGVNRDQAGALQQSADHTRVTLGGYDAELGADTNSSEAPDTLRVIATVDEEGVVDVSTSLAGAYHERHIRGVATVDGSRFWTGGHGNDAAGDMRAGVLTIQRGGDLPVAVTTGGSTVNNARVPVIHDGQLYVSSDRSGYHGVNRVGTGLPEGEIPMELVAAAPAGMEVPHDFAFVGEHLYVAYTEGEAGIVRYAADGDAWVADGVFAGQFWGLTGRVAGDQAVLYGTRGSDAGNELVAMLDTPGADFADADSQVLAVADPNTAFRGVAFGPGFVPSDAPVAFEPLPTVAFDARVAGGSGNALAAVLGAENNPVARGTITDPTGEALTVTAASADQTVVTDDALTLDIDADGGFTLSAVPAAAGTTTITVTAAAADGRTASARLSYAVAPPLADDTAVAHFGVADASAAYDVGEGHMLVADDDSNAIRLFGPVAGEPVAEFDFTAQMAHVTDRTFDLEGAARIGDTIYWVGSLGNSRSGNVWPHRDIVFATTVHGSGADTTLEFAGEATGFRDALVAWDAADGHGWGAGALQFDRATQPGYSAEGPNSLNLEGATIAPDGSTLWMGFRSPLVPVAADPAGTAGDLALVIGVADIASVVAGGEVVISDSFTLDLGGRAIRDISETDDGNYLIMAGSADDSGDFALFGWTGNPEDAPVRSVTPLGLEGWAGSYEAIPGAASLADGTVIRVLQDAGTVDIFGTGAEAQDLTREHMLFPSHDYTLDFDGAFAQAEDEESDENEEPTENDEGTETPADDADDATAGSGDVSADGDTLPTTGAQLSVGVLLLTVALLAAGAAAVRRQAAARR